MTSVLLLRGAGFVGANRLAVTGLRGALEWRGARGVEAVIQGGNAVFERRLAPVDVTADLPRSRGLIAGTVGLDEAAFLVASNPIPGAEAEIAAACESGERVRPRHPSRSRVAPSLLRPIGMRPAGRNRNTAARIAGRVRARA